MTSKEEKIIVVSWDGDDDPENPKNWSYSQKWIATGLISTYTMLSPITSSMIAPAARDVAKDLGATSHIFEPLLTSIFILAYAFGPLFFGPVSQVYGRSRVVQLGNVFYMIFNLVCAFAKTPSQMLAFRFLAGIGGSAPLALGGGVINDCWSVKERGRAVTLYALAPLLGPIIGPIAGAWIAMKTTWKWVFWSTSIAAVFVQAISFFWLKETFAPLLLARKARKLQNASSGEDNVIYVTSHQQNPSKYTMTDTRELFLTCLTRPPVHKLLLYPVVLLLTEPTAQLLGIYLAYIYVILTSIPDIYVVVYHESIGIAGLHYIAFGIGLYSGAQITNAILDELYLRLSAHYGTEGRPEFRIPIMLPATLFVPIGLFITGWTVSSGVHWIVPDIGLVITGMGIAVNWQAIQTYIIDTYTVRAAPALGGLSLLRSLVGFALPLASPSLYQHLGYGKGNTILASCALGLGFPM
ncbi:MFS general substrate transporter [Guyanagaster necrorhizus]|uniref:MFS general substrate transporter n=1 Tax=Guyanagaster necrorhizus TaxID=856835 RepID=A0A9P7VUR5_9AGAR|nr:MFS general substrate transporter [Guyanagaster necrorhizus MCA 3950]KAG7447085.1 MFS general substrate transporter [Guyanagaster necrorhizus MCA 3950]